ncbi:unnamed protein product [Prunus armeniaca]|uniref:Cupin type-1 domain-containing protein n=1 Tax=Prunus armeniaca TaxID=36596 RepID=A0A6J5TZ10_PRUAR|nr:unnamed protein product [Prunus armeniaca]
MKGVHFLISTLAILASATFLVSASDPSPLQDFCVALDDTKCWYAGLNTLGISLTRIDFAPNGLNPPHTHPRASEFLWYWKDHSMLVSSHPTVMEIAYSPKC